MERYISASQQFTQGLLEEKKFQEVVAEPMEIGKEEADPAKEIPTKKKKIDTNYEDLLQRNDVETVYSIEQLQNYVSMKKGLNELLKKIDVALSESEGNLSVIGQFKKKVKIL